jgi:2-polyprenyl-3-methyl-5-hydroxy-6-metoxy-1,4-benzoquinol methylase
MTIYNKQEIAEVLGIPVFSTNNDYVDNYEEISQTHLDALKETGHNPFMDTKSWEELEFSTKELIEKYQVKKGKILDVGVGLGRLLSSTNIDMEKFGMDISLPYLKQASKLNIECCMSMIEDMPYKKELFDVVVSTDVLEHVLDINLAVKNIFSVLKKGGIFILRVPYKEDLQAYLTEDCPYKYVHLRNFDEHTLICLFEKIFDFKVIEWQTVGFVEAEQYLKVKPFPYNKYLGKITRWYYNQWKKKDIKTYKSFYEKTEINMIIRK